MLKFRVFRKKKEDEPDTSDRPEEAPSHSGTPRGIPVRDLSGREIRSLPRFQWSKLYRQYSFGPSSPKPKSTKLFPIYETEVEYLEDPPEPGKTQENPLEKSEIKKDSPERMKTEKNASEHGKMEKKLPK